MNDLISIIIPVYNSEKYLPDCLESVLGQTYTELEIIIVDDGSVDSSLSIARKYAQRDARIKIFHKDNGGVSSARNKGLEEATGAFVAFVDSDDTLIPEMCERLISEFNDNIDMVIGGIRHDFNGSSKTYMVQSKVELSPDRTEELFDCLMKIYLINTPCARLYRRRESGMPYFDEKFSIGEDFLFNITYMDNMKNKIIAIPDIVYFYNRENDGAATSRFRRTDMDNEIELNKAINAFREKHGWKAFRGDIIDRRLYINGMNFLLQVFESNIDHLEKREILCEALMKKAYYEVCTVKYRKSVKEDIYRFLCKRKWTGMIELYYQVYSFLRRSLKHG